MTASRTLPFIQRHQTPPSRSPIHLLSRKLPCTMRSITMAQRRMARPARRPWPLAAYCRDCSTTEPSPCAPIRLAVTTIDRHIRMVWLMPARIDGRASGNSTPRSIWHSVAPKPRAASLKSSGTTILKRCLSLINSINIWNGMRPLYLFLFLQSLREANS